MKHQLVRLSHNSAKKNEFKTEEQNKKLRKNLADEVKLLVHKPTQRAYLKKKRKPENWHLNTI